MDQDQMLRLIQEQVYRHTLTNVHNRAVATVFCEIAINNYGLPIRCSLSTYLPIIANRLTHNLGKF